MAITRSFSDLVAEALGADPKRTWYFLSRWEPYENSGAEHNPLGVTVSSGGDTGNFNSVGVKNFGGERDGALSTAAMLRNGRYENILSYLRGGNLDREGIAGDLRTWGTGSRTGDYPFANEFAQAPGAPATGSGQTDLNTSDSGAAADDMRLRQKLQTEGERLWDIVTNPSDPDSAEVANAYQALDSILAEIATIDQRWADVTDRSNLNAQNAFMDLMKVGDFKQTQADRAFDRWLSKRDRALATTEGEIASAVERNQANADIAAARRGTAGLGPTPETKTYIPGNYEDTLAKWNRRLGTGTEPSADYRTYSSPATPPAFSTYSPRGPETAGGGAAGSSAATTPQGVPQGVQRAWDVVDQTRRPSFARPPEPEKPRGWFGTNDSGDLFGIPGTSRPEVQNWDVTKALGAATGALGRWFTHNVGPDQGSLTNSIRGAPGDIAGAGTALQRWWNEVVGGRLPMGRVLSHADGTLNAPGGKAMVGERGPETQIDPQGGVSVVGQQGPEVRDIAPGSAILPADIPPEEVYMFTQIMQGLQGGGRNPDAERQQRMNDPNLAKKVRDSLMQAVAAEDASNPPRLPTLVGQWPMDPWQDLRPLVEPPVQEVQRG